MCLLRLMCTLVAFGDDMDTAVEEEVHPNEDGSFTIIINARISQTRQMIAYQHALEHIMRDDFSKTDADEIEKAM